MDGHSCVAHGDFRENKKNIYIEKDIGDRVVRHSQYGADFYIDSIAGQSWTRPKGERKSTGNLGRTRQRARESRIGNDKLLARGRRIIN